MQRCATAGTDRRVPKKRLLARARRVVVAVIGMTVLLIGVAMIVLPGPAFVVIPAGLAILATEFVWARRLLQRVKDRIPITRR